MGLSFHEAIEKRRSIYALGNTSPVSDEKIREVIEHTVKYVPSSFNSQSSRVVLLLGENHRKLWNITKEILRKIVPAEAFFATEQKIDNSFAAGYGTVLFYEDQEVVEGLQKQFAAYSENFPIWSQQTSGMHQLAIWTALEELGLGASLQHYNPLIDEEVAKEWKINPKWKLIAQMPFGTPKAEAAPKEFAPLDKRVLVFK